MIAWRTLACTVVVCLAASGCGDDGDLSTGLSGGVGSNNGSESGSSSSSSSSSTSPTTTPDPTTGDATTNDTNQTTNTTPPGTTSGPDTTTSGPDTTTTDTTNTTNTTMTTNTTQPPGGCGNGAIDPNEQCDGANLNGFTCESLGNAGGTLGCDPVTCTFDTSMCMGNDPGTTG